MTAANAHAAFAALAPLDRWVTYALVPSTRRPGKLDKIPHNGERGLSTARPEDWTALDEALGLSMVHPDLHGVGITMTGGIEQGEHLLCGMDFDGLDPKKAIESVLNEIEALAGYCELSPSGNGLRAFAWVPKAWAAAYKDSMKAHPGFCDHAEIYFGTSPRFLTVTFNAQRLSPIKTLDAAALKKLEAWGLTPRAAERDAAPPILDTGSPLELQFYKLTDKQRRLVSGQHAGLDRSAVLHGLTISLIDQGAPAEDVLATIVKNEHLWAYCLDHRHDAPERALIFAKDEVQRGTANSKAARGSRLASINEAWKPKITVNHEKPRPPEIPIPVKAAPTMQPPPGILQELEQWMLQSSAKPDPTYARATAIAFASICCAGYLAQPWDVRTSPFYVIVLGDTGTGKESCRTHLYQALRDAGLGARVGPAGYHSPAAVYSALEDSKEHLTVIDEIGPMLKAMQARGKENEKSALYYLASLYGTGTVNLNAYSTQSGSRRKAASEPLHGCAVTLLGMTTPAAFEEVYTPEWLHNGIFGRMVVIESTSQWQPLARYAPVPLPPNLKIWVKALLTRRITAGGGLGWAPEAETARQQCELEIHEFEENLARIGVGGLMNRLHENSLRLALAVQLALDPMSKEITAPAVLWAHQELLFYARRFQLRALAMKGKSGDRSDVQESVLEFVKKAGKAISAGDVQNRVWGARNMRASEIREILGNLCDMEVLVEVTIGGAQGQPLTRYVAA